MPKGRTQAKARVVAWWLSGGEEECPHCGQVYAYEVEFRCPDCDSPSCPHCKRGHADVCLACVEPSKEEAGEDAEGRSHG
jgi:hypothetical protein